MRRAAVSVLSNIPEGAARRSRRDYLHFLHIAKGSRAELDAQVELAMRLSYSVEKLAVVTQELTPIGRLLNAQIVSLKC
jgi:four helix bundle protein